ncbi:hypothetical protein K501DRAFT_170838 [Backusella circina FSU 941]|nr:hypothetical protein K501DRAFT_170838 [Backusella circina FSU 941]
MDDPQSSLTIASRHFDNGQIKDAYSQFLSTAQDAIKPLFDVKFVHSSIVSKPRNYASLLSILHTCIDHIETIIDQHSPYPKMAPPLPPKPSNVNGKPVLPPKPSAPLPSKSTAMKRSYYMRNQTVADGEIDPTHLVPAQTNTSDSLTPNIPSSINTNHVPYIPIPPLLTTHRVLQAKLDELESSLKDYRVQKQQLNSGEQSHMTETELNEAIHKYTPYVAEAKHTLNKVRTLYMSAATIPTILHFQPGLVAYQITRIESAIFLAIPSHALLTHSAKNPHPRIVASTDFFNYVTRLIEHSILLPQEGATRAQHINHWIKVASKCQELNNYQSLKAIISALGTPPVQRIRRTWAYIPKKSMARLDTLSELMSEANNYGKYREHMGIVSTTVLNGKSVNLIQAEHFKKPTVPFLGTFIHDMTYLLAAVQQSQPAAAAPGVPVRTSSRANIQPPDPKQDPRISSILELVQTFQSCPKYDRKPNSLNAKTVQKSNNQSRPILSQAIHRSKSSFGRLGGAIGFGNGDNNESNGGDKERPDDFDPEEQQSLVTQYILTRPWVRQNTVDELSILREPVRPVKPNMGRSSSVGSHYASSLMSNNSIMRISSGASTFDGRPESLDETSRSYIYGRNSAATGPLTSSSTIDDGLASDDDDDLSPVVNTQNWNMPKQGIFFFFYIYHCDEYAIIFNSFFVKFY